MPPRVPFQCCALSNTQYSDSAAPSSVAFPGKGVPLDGLAGFDGALHAIQFHSQCSLAPQRGKSQAIRFENYPCAAIGIRHGHRPENSETTPTSLLKAFWPNEATVHSYVL